MSRKSIAVLMSALAFPVAVLLVAGCGGGSTGALVKEVAAQNAELMDMRDASLLDVSCSDTGNFEQGAPVYSCDVEFKSDVDTEHNLDAAEDELRFERGSPITCWIYYSDGSVQAADEDC